MVKKKKIGLRDVPEEKDETPDLENNSNERPAE